MSLFDFVYVQLHFRVFLLLKVIIWFKKKVNQTLRNEWTWSFNDTVERYMYKYKNKEFKKKDSEKYPKQKANYHIDSIYKKMITNKK